MKKLFACLLVLALCLPLAASAAVDLSGMTFEELIALRAEVDAALWASDGWQSVNVPVGGYVVGRDIPAGHWTISANPKSYCYVSIGTALDSTGMLVENDDFWASLMGKECRIYKEGEVTSIDVILSEGQCIAIEESDCFFTPFVGKSLGFK